MVLSANDKGTIRDRIKKQIELAKERVKPAAPPPEPEIEEGEET